MKAVGYYKSLPIDDESALVDLELDTPDCGAHDLLVEVKAVSVNPVDTKIRRSAQPENGAARILGFDAAGVVTQIGSAVSGFKIGDEVFYAGAINRQGSNAQLQAVDYRICALKPRILDFPAAAALPLTALTAWEMLFDRLRIDAPVRAGKNTLLMVGAAGGVGSIAMQLAAQLSGVRVIATASRAQSEDWARQMGAHDVIDYREAMAPQLKALGIDGVDYIFSTANSDGYHAQFAQIIGAQGRIGLIDGPVSFDIVPFKPKSVSLHWEYMFTRSLFSTDDMAGQGVILGRVAKMIDEGQLKATATEVLSPLDAATLRAAHQRIESGQHIGKLVIAGF